MSSNNDDYKVTYGKPPKHSQFKPGQSGYPKGRLKGSKNTSTLLAEELNSQVTIVENGKRRKISKRQAMIKHLANKGATGDPKATATLLNELRAREASQSSDGISSVPIGPADEIVIADIVRRIRMAADPLPDSKAEPKTKRDGEEVKGEEGDAP